MSSMDTPVKAAVTTFDIIESLREMGGAGVSELADRLDMPTSTIHDHLRTLESKEYLINDDGVYHVGARFLELGDQARDRMKVYSVARPEVDDLAQETGEHANMLIEEHGWGVFLYKTRGPDAVQLDTHPGMRVHMQTTAMGKAILAHRDRAEVEAILDRRGMPAVTNQTVTDRDELFAELEEIRERGVAFDDAERVTGIRCVAAAITDDEGQAVAAISVSAPESRMLGEKFTDSVPERVLRSVNIIEVNLTYS